MKIGYRKPSISKKFKSKTTARVKRATKSSINPLYGKKGMGYVNNPKKAVYNKVYNKTTKSLYDEPCIDLSTDYDDFDYDDFDYDDYDDTCYYFDDSKNESTYLGNDDDFRYLRNNKNQMTPFMKKLLIFLIFLNIIVWTLLILAKHYY